ncbi:hypothetical protein L1987_44310 [Smallanthus sonchifolius]|uniref:Uncharacterized protein n=1 Tax=Smallanthus sonchifolius TaxID=185202 RepID=A0ACB9GPR0_9ASTR|nr:hypothetical protein L1987_44310 [Smallanthus sonchifolius]
MEKVKLMCSYGGKIHHRPHDRKLSYVGGDTKILTVDRSINFSNLLSKLNALCEYNFEIQLKYKLPGQDLDALVSVFDDEDVENMLFEYDLLRRISATPIRLRLFVFFPAAVSTPVTARSVNPDFLFGFDKEYPVNIASAVNNYEITETVVSPPGNAGLIDVTPMLIQEIQAQLSDNSTVTRGSYLSPTPLVYQSSMASGGFFQAGLHRGGGNREQPVVYGFIPGGNREQPVVYGFIPVMPSVSQEVPNIPMSGSPLSYDATRGELQLSTAMMTATSNHHESKFAPGPQHDA